MKSAALMFDVVESRRYYERYDVQDILMCSVQYLNSLYKNRIKKEVVASAGDEFQGLFLDIQSAFAYIRKLQLLVYPIKLRCGIGFGEIKYDIDSWLSTAFDGEAYYLCRDAINAVSYKKSNAICFNTASKYDRYLNAFCRSNAEIKSRQSQMARLIELIADIIYPLNEIEEDMGFYAFILNKRLKLIEQETWNKVRGKYREVNPLNIDFEYLFTIKKEIEHQREYNNSIYSSPIIMEDFWLHGMSTYIAKSLNTTRQNIDRYVSLGKIKESRTADKAIFDLLGEEI